MNVKYIHTSVFAGILGLFLTASEANEVDIQVSEAWIPEAPPMVPTMAGYFKLDNLSDTPIVLVSISSPSFKRVELHRTEIIEGMARMKPQDRVAVPANGTLLFKPGSYHLMLKEPVETLFEGDTVRLQFQFDHGQKLDVTARVKKVVP